MHTTRPHLLSAVVLRNAFLSFFRRQSSYLAGKRELSFSEPAERQLYHDNFNVAYYDRADRRMAQFQITTGNGLPTSKRT